MEVEAVSKPIAVAACSSMAVLYVAILYAPTQLFRLPHPSSVKDFMLRRFACAAISSLLSLLLSALILPVSLSDLLLQDRSFSVLVLVMAFFFLFFFLVDC